MGLELHTGTAIAAVEKAKREPTSDTILAYATYRHP